MEITNMRTKFLIPLFASLFLMIASTGVQAAVDIFLKIEGVDGEARDKEFNNWIDVLAFSEGMSQSGTTHVGGGGGAGKASLQDLSVTKYIDSSSPFIRQNLVQGKHIPEARLVVRKAGENPVVFFEIILKDVLLTSVSAGGSGGEDRLTENVTINFREVTWRYTPVDALGNPGPVIEAGWDVAANAPL